MPTSNYSAACSAGAAFGLLSFLSRTVTGIIATIQISTSTGEISNIFGVFKHVWPEPVTVTDDEYEQIERRYQNLWARSWEAMLPWMDCVVTCFNCCCYCNPWISREYGRELREMVEESRQEMNQITQGMIPLDDLEAGLSTTERWQQRVDILVDGWPRTIHTASMPAM